MKKLWIWVGAAAVLLSAAGLVGARTEQGKRVIRYLDRRYEVTDQGRRAAFQALWLQAKREFNGKVDQQWGAPYKKADYPAKAKLLVRRGETIIALKQDLIAHADEYFVMDLLLALGPDTARPLLADVMDDGRCYYPAPAFHAALAGSFTPQQLEQMAMDLPGNCGTEAFMALPKEAVTPEFLERLVVKRNGPSGLPYWVMTEGVHIRAFPKLDRAGKISVIQTERFTGNPSPPSQFAEWLATEEDPAVRQELLYTLGDKAALLKAIDQDGAFKGTTFWTNWHWMKEAVQQYPDSFMARGIKAYEAVRGLPYFGIDRKEAGVAMWEHGNPGYNCTREIPGWEEYLKQYSKHDGAGDAAYRLGRCYEITGQYEKALKTLRLAMDLPTGEMADHAQLRIAWVLDVVMSEAELASVRLDDPGLTTAAAYSLAVRDLRAGRYAKAVERFDAVLAQTDQRDPVPHTWYGSFWTGARKQRNQAAMLRDLAAQATQDAKYAVAATMYHDDLLFYNYLWAGGKLNYLTEHEGLALRGDMEPSVAAWAAGSSSYLQAAQAFEPLDSVPGAVGEKAAYSRAMALLQATRGLTPDVPLWRPRQQVETEAVNLLKRFVEARPMSDLSPEALLNLGLVTGEQSYLDRIGKEYPNSDTIVPAKASQRRTPTYSSVPFRYMTIDEAPAPVSAWAKPFLGSLGSRSMTFGEDTYVLSTTDEPGAIAQFIVVQGAEGGETRVGSHWRTDARSNGQGYGLIRFRTTGEPVIIH